MKKMFKLICVLGLLLASGCSSKGNSDFDPIEAYGCDVLNVYNWGEYIGEDVLYNFEKQYNVKVNYSLFDSNEQMYTSLLGGNAYDILVPSEYFLLITLVLSLPSLSIYLVFQATWQSL